MRINDNIKSVIINMMPSDSTKLFTGRIGITNLDGEFIIGYRVNNGTLISKLVKSNKTTTMHRKGQGELCDYHADGDPNCMFTDTVLDEVVITVQSNDQGLDPFDEGGSDYEDDLSNPEWNFGDGNPNGGGNNNNNSDTCPGNKVKNPSTGICECPEGYIEDFNGNCVLDPCSKIKLENQNPVFYNKINYLKGKTNQNTETGYRQNKDGSYTYLTDTNNGHSLDIPLDRLSTVGFMHTHLDDYLTGEIDKITKLPVKRKPIKMFSPNDLFNFLRIVKNTKYNGVPLSSVYATMVSSAGTYTLRFTGNPSDVSNNINLSDREFEEYIKENGKEKGFLKYLKDKVTINGIELYKVKDNGTVQKKSLSSDGESVDSEDCN